ncbi:hypothetical protein JW898_03045 [Candidatus Woesearchaeota archaeon]|nr:hypothetical protein [Candidatus Woesearchaeota archaeon]
MVFCSKKGLSPLIASVLLIVVVVGIGAVVTGIVRNYISENKQVIEKTSTDTDCSTQVEVEVPRINDDFLICLGVNTVNFTIENTGSMFVDEFQVKVFGDAGFDDADGVLPEGLAPGQVNSSVIVSHAAVGNVQEVYIIPKKKVTGSANKIYCSDAQLRFADIADC